MKTVSNCPPFAPAHQSWSAKLLATDDICHTRWWLRYWPRYFAHGCHLTRKWPASKRPLFPGRSSKWDEWNDIYQYNTYKLHEFINNYFRLMYRKWLQFWMQGNKTWKVESIFRRFPENSAPWPAWQTKKAQLRLQKIPPIPWHRLIKQLGYLLRYWALVRHFRIHQDPLLCHNSEMDANRTQNR